VESSIKETIESIIVAFILAFVFRAFVVEAFVIPTGSMAPTLLGQHMDLRCPMCGYEFVSGPRDLRGRMVGGEPERVAAPYQGEQPAGRGQRTPPLQIDCPMCGYPITERLVHTRAGDRILVLKYVYGVTEPRRWDVVVFRNPEKPTQNYIKRLIGLPNERLQLVRGNVYTRPLDARTGEPTGPWRVQRKPPRVQRAVWQPVYHSRYVPLDAETRPWRSPWTPDDARWSAIDHGRAFAFDGGQAGRLRFDFSQDRRTGRDYYPYNVLPDMRQQARRGSATPLGTETLIEDMRIAATIAPEGQITARLNFASDLVRARATIGTDGSANIALADANDAGPLKTVARTDAVDWPAGERARLALWHVDHALGLWINGQQVLRHEMDLPRESDGRSSRGPVNLTMPRLIAQGRPRRAPQASLQLAGSAARVSEVNLDRDLYYMDTGYNGMALGRHDNPADIGPDEFFCLGDNSPRSKDSRWWGQVNPWISYHTRAGHEHYAADGVTRLGGVPPGFVPRKLMIGRAFFVYFPSPEGLNPTAFPIVLNFGELRFID
jgi:signal peptidase I